jgi:autotransporter-associated beta strand protein
MRTLTQSLTLTSVAMAIRSLWTLANNGGTSYYQERSTNNAVLVGAAVATVPAGVLASYAGVLSGAGSLTVTGGGQLTTTTTQTYAGTTTVTGGSTFTVGTGTSLSGTSGAITQGGGTLQVRGTVALGAGRHVVIGSGGVGTTGTTVVEDGGTLSVTTGAFLIGGAVTGTVYGSGVLTLNPGGAVTVSAVGAGGSSYDASAVWLNPYGGTASTSATLNFNGGVYATARGTNHGGGAGTPYFYFNGTVVRALASLVATPLFATVVGPGADVRNGGLIVDTNGFNCTLGIALVHSRVSGDAAIDGGLTKTGTGTLTHNSPSGYTGPTTVNGGTLSIGNATALGASAVGTVNSGGTLTYTVNTTGTRTVTVNAGGVINRGGFAHTGTTFINNGGTINP